MEKEKKSNSEGVSKINPKLERIQKIKMMMSSITHKKGKIYKKLEAELKTLTEVRARELYDDAKSRALTKEELDEVMKDYIGITWKKN
jgi:hypothetical protein